MLTTQECVMTKILDCGTADLSLLNDINYDLDDIIDSLMENNCLSLNGIFQEVFIKGAEELQEEFENKKEDIKAEILSRIEEEKTEWVESGEMTQEELEETEEHEELISDLTLIESGDLQPTNDLEFYLNYQDTHVYMKHIDFYRRYMENTVDDIEYKMGWSFKNID